MAIKAFELFGTIDLQQGKLQTGLKSANQGLKQLENQTKSSVRVVENELNRMSKFKTNFNQGFMSSFGIQGGGGIGSLLGSGAGNIIQSGVKSLTGGLTDLFEKGMTFADDLQKWKISFENLLGGDKTKGLEHLIELLKYGHDSAFETKDVIDYAVRLEAVGIKANETKDAIEALGGALARTGNFGQGNMQSGILAITQMLGKEKISAQEMTIQLANAGVASPYGIAARGFNRLGYRDDAGKEFTTGSIQKLGEEDRLNASMFVRILLSQMAVESKGMLDRIVGSTISGQKAILDDQKTFVSAAAILGVDPSNTAALVGDPGGAYGQNLAKMKLRIREWSGPQASKVAGTMGSGAEKYFQISNALEESTFQQLGAANTWGDMMKDGPLKFGQNLSHALSAGITGAMKDAGIQDAVVGYFGVDVWNGLTTFWETHSPSKKSERMGQWIAEGLELGLSKKQAGNYANMKALSAQSPDFMRKLGEGAAKLGINPNDLLNVIATESSFNPGAFNKFGYAGLMQIGKREAAHMGTSSAAIAKMPAEQQLDYMFKFLAERLAPLIKAGTPIGLAQLYATVGSGHATGDPNAIHMARGGKRAAAYANNPLWDANKDGIVRESEFGQAAMASLGAGKFFSINNSPLSQSNPMPVAVVSAFAGGEFTGGAGGFQMPRNKFITSRRGSGRSSGTMDDPFPVAIDVAIEKLEPITESFRDLAAEGLTPMMRPLQSLIELTKDAAASTTDERAKLESEFGSAIKDGGKSKAKKDKLFDAAFTKEGVAGDFQGGFQSLLAGLGHDKPMSLLKQFGLGLIQDIQGRLAHDFSSMLTGSLFGNRGEDGKLSGGLLSSIFGSLFGGKRASGGDTMAGRFYIAGEHGPELIAGGGHVYNASQTRGMLGGGEHRTIVVFGDHEAGRAMEAYGNTGRGRRARLIQAKYGRKLQAVGY